MNDNFQQKVYVFHKKCFKIIIITSQDNPVCPGGHAHSSTSAACPNPVFSVTAESKIKSLMVVSIGLDAEN